jgi:hypothetical protein
MAAREVVFTRVLPKTRRMLDVIAEEMAAEEQVRHGEAPFWNSKGEIVQSEVIRRLLGKADSRLIEP